MLNEMLTGKRPFDGDDATDVLVAILGRQPADLNALRADVPVAIRTLLRRCLEKDRRKRIGDIAAALVLIEEVGALSAAHGSSSAIVERSVPLWRRLAIYSVPALLAGAVIVGGAVWFATRSAPPRVSRLEVTTTPTTTPTIEGVDRDMAITADGSRVVYIGNTARELLVRSLEALEPVVCSPARRTACSCRPTASGSVSSTDGPS